MSIFKTIFNPKTWSKVKTKIVGSSKSFFGVFSRSTKSGWAYAKKIYAKSPNTFSAIIAGVTVGFISKALFRSHEALDAVAERDARNYGISDQSDPHLQSRKLSHHVDVLVNTLQALSYARAGTDNYKAMLVTMGQQYHDLINNQDADMVDLSITVDKVMGSAYRLGVKPELSKDSPVVYSAMLNAKDDESNPEDIASDIINVVYLDSFRIPMMAV